MSLLAAFIALFLLLWAIFYAAAPALRNAGAFAANRLTRLSLRSRHVQRIVAYSNRFRDYYPLALIIAGGGLLAAGAGDGFLDLTEMLHTRSPAMQDIDGVTHAWAVSRRSADATLFFAAMSVIGGPWGLASIAAVVTIVLLVARRYRWAAYLLITSLGGAVIDLELKRYFARARPALAEMLREAHGYSFPSGHAMGSTIVFGALSYLAFRALPQWRWKTATLALACTLIAAVALSRVYLGAHWTSDVAAGVAAGTLWLTTTTMTYEVVRRIRRMRVMQQGAGRV